MYTTVYYQYYYYTLFNIIIISSSSISIAQYAIKTTTTLHLICKEKR